MIVKGGVYFLTVVLKKEICYIIRMDRYEKYCL